MEPRLCVIVPVYNHGLTVGSVARLARRHLPVYVVDDGSTDDTPAAVARETGLVSLRLPSNRGKGAALRAGFDRALDDGFTHAITIDADGQHPVEAVDDFITACRRHPTALISGVRDFARAGAPWLRRASNALSNVWFRVETGIKLGDTQCGYRCYPLAAIRPLQITSERYAFELELLVRSAWAGIPLVALPILADYQAPTSRLSHFDPLRDFLRVSRVHARLTWMALQRGTRPADK